MSDIQLIDLLIVGSGPAGISTALHLIQQERSWSERMVIIDKAVHPREKLCGGGITHLGYNVLRGLGLDMEPNHFWVREAKLQFEELSYSFKANPAFIVVRRSEFDHWLVQKARQQQITVNEGEALIDIAVFPEYVKVTTDKQIYHAQAVVAADGSRSIVRQKLKWEDDSRVARLLEIATPEDPQETVEFQSKTAVFDFTPMLNQKLQGYYWDFPSYVAGEPFMNRGVFDSRAQPKREKADLKGTLGSSLEERERKLADYPLKGHPIRWFDPKGRFAIPRVLLAGDAAGADAFMGEGISFALAYGDAAAGELIAAFAAADFSFGNYRQRLIKHPIIKQLPLRTKVARFAYKIRSRRFVRWGWKAARWGIRFTPWHDPEYIPWGE